MARAYAIHEHILIPFNKSWAEISVSNLRRGGIIDAQLYNYGKNRTWVRGAVLSAVERFGVDPVKGELGVDDMAVMRAKLPELTAALDERILDRKFWRRMVSDLNIPKRMKDTVVNGASIEERLGALLIAERTSAIRDLRKIRAII